MRLKKLAATATAVLLTVTAVPAAHAQSSNPFGLSSSLSSGSSQGGGTSASAAERREVGGRSYLIEKPANYQPDKYIYPVIIGFGGWKHSAERFRDYADLEQAARGAIRIYPEPLANSQGLGWEGPRYAPTYRGQDVQFVRDIVAQLRKDESINTKKIYATGLSNGGGMALNLACQAPDLVAAVAVVASANYTPIFDGCSGQVPTMFIHGDKDNIAPYSRDGSNPHGGRYYSARTAFRKIGQRNGCFVDGYMTETSGDGFTRFDYSGCSKQVSLARVNGGGHTWFPYSPDAAYTAWDFVRQYSK